MSFMNEPPQYLTDGEINRSIVENLPLSYVGGSSSNTAVPGGEGDVALVHVIHHRSGIMAQSSNASFRPYFRMSVETIAEATVLPVNHQPDRSQLNPLRA